MNIEFCGREDDDGNFPGCCAIVLAALFLVGVCVLIYTAMTESGFDEEPEMPEESVVPAATGTMGAKEALRLSENDMITAENIVAAVLEFGALQMAGNEGSDEKKGEER